MRRKDMQPGVLYAILRNGMPRPGYIFDAKTERIRCRVYWTWPPSGWVEGQDYRDTDYLDPQPDLLNPLAKFDDNLIVKTSDVIGEWEPFARAEKAERAARLQAKLAEEAQEAADKAAELASNTARVEALRPYLAGIEGYLSIDNLLKDVTYGWTRSSYSAKDVVTLLEQALATLALNGGK
jgi:hypothetical protein